jgi:DNA-binding transcriptional LysR family regulator
LLKVRWAQAVTLKQMRALRAVREGGSMTAAAGALNLTVPAVHLQIKALEDMTQTRLVRRADVGAGTALTDAGLALAEAAARIDLVLQQAQARVDALAAGRAGRVVLGVVSTGKYFAPRLVKTLNGLVPEVEIVLRVGNREAVIAELDRDQIDIAIMGRPPREPVVAAQPLGPHPHGLVAAPDHPLAGCPAPGLAELADEVFLARESGSGTRILMTRFLDRLGEGHEFRLVEMGSNETIKQAVMAGLGIAFLSLHTVTDECAAGRLVSLAVPGLPIRRQWFLVRREGAIVSAAAARVAAEILALAGAFLPQEVAPASL